MSIQIGVPSFINSAASPAVMVQPIPKYAPLATRQSPVKKPSADLNGLESFLRTKSHRSNGKTLPQSGPPHTSNRGEGFGSTSVREKSVNGSTTRRIRPPPANAARTCPDSCTAIMAIQEIYNVTIAMKARNGRFMNRNSPFESLHAVGAIEYRFNRSDAPASATHREWSAVSADPRRR